MRVQLQPQIDQTEDGRVIVGLCVAIAAAGQFNAPCARLQINGRLESLHLQIEHQS